MSASDHDEGAAPKPGVTLPENERIPDEGLGTVPQEWRFTQLWTAAQPTVESYVRAILGDRAAVDDVLQEVAMAVYTQFERYDTSRPFVAWALGIARNKARDRQRTQARQHQFVRDPAVLDALAAVAEEIDEEMEQRRLALHDCLNAVEGRADELLRLHYHDGHEPRDIADKLGLQAGHVRVLLNRVRATLKQCVERSLRKRGS